MAAVPNQGTAGPPAPSTPQSRRARKETVTSVIKNVRLRNDNFTLDRLSLRHWRDAVRFLQRKTTTPGSFAENSALSGLIRRPKFDINPPSDARFQLLKGKPNDDLQKSVDNANSTATYKWDELFFIALRGLSDANRFLPEISREAAHLRLDAFQINTRLRDFSNRAARMEEELDTLKELFQCAFLHRVVDDG